MLGLLVCLLGASSTIARGSLGGGALRTPASPRAAVLAGGNPMVPFKVPNSEYFQWMGVYDRMARERILFLGGGLDDRAVNSMIATLLYLENDDRKNPVNLYLNVPGALTKSGFALYDTMRSMAFPIGTVNLGMCAHMGAFICAAGTKGRRSSLPNSRFVLQAPAMVMASNEEVPIMQAEDVSREAREVLKDRARLVQGYSELTGQPEDVLLHLFKRNAYFDAHEAKAFGLIDNVLSPKTGKKEKSSDNMGFGAFNSKPSPVSVGADSSSRSAGTGSGRSGDNYEPQTM